MMDVRRTMLLGALFDDNRLRMDALEGRVTLYFHDRLVRGIRREGDNYRLRYDREGKDVQIVTGVAVIEVRRVSLLVRGA